MPFWCLVLHVQSVFLFFQKHLGSWLIGVLKFHNAMSQDESFSCSCQVSVSPFSLDTHILQFWSTSLFCTFGGFPSLTSGTPNTVKPWFSNILHLEQFGFQPFHADTYLSGNKGENVQVGVSLPLNLMLLTSWVIVLWIVSFFFFFTFIAVIVIEFSFLLYISCPFCL